MLACDAASETKSTTAVIVFVCTCCSVVSPIASIQRGDRVIDAYFVTAIKYLADDVTVKFAGIEYFDSSARTRNFKLFFL